MHPDIKLSQTLYSRTQQAHSIVDGEVVIMDTEADEYICFGVTGSFIWNLLEQAISVEKLAKAVSEKFEVAYETALSDCGEFIEVLASKKLVEQSLG